MIRELLQKFCQDCVIILGCVVLSGGFALMWGLNNAAYKLVLHV